MASDMRRLLEGLPGKMVVFTQIYPGYDKIARRRPRLAGLFRGVTYFLESTPLSAFGISHLVVYEKAAG